MAELKPEEIIKLAKMVKHWEAEPVFGCELDFLYDIRTGYVDKIKIIMAVWTATVFDGDGVKLGKCTHKGIGEISDHLDKNERENFEREEKKNKRRREHEEAEAMKSRLAAARQLLRSELKP